MRKVIAILLILFFVSLVYTEYATASDRYYRGHRSHNYGGHYQGNLGTDLLILGAAIGTLGIVNAITNPPAYYAPAQPMCTRQINYGYWARDIYGNPYWVTTGVGHEYVPCSPRF